MSEKSEYLVILDPWDYVEHFLPPAKGHPLHSIVNDVESYIERRDLASHAFFAYASADRGALTHWLAQELVMTNAFSQIVLSAASRVRNVHVRSILTEVAYGEHGRAKQGIARGAHPWLLHRLALSMKITAEMVRPAKATIKLIRSLEESVHNGSIAAIAWIGVGNERLIIPEYTAVQRCFAQVLPSADYKPFLTANLTEDVAHSRLCYEAASTLIAEDDNAAAFYYAQAVASIDARWDYFTELTSDLA